MYEKVPLQGTFKDLYGVIAQDTARTTSKISNIMHNAAVSIHTNHISADHKVKDRPSPSKGPTINRCFQFNL